MKLHHYLAALLVMPPVGLISAWTIGAFINDLLRLDSLPETLILMLGIGFPAVVSGWLTSLGMRDADAPTWKTALVTASAAIAALEAVALILLLTTYAGGD